MGVQRVAVGVRGTRSRSIPVTLVVADSWLCLRPGFTAFVYAETGSCAPVGARECMNGEVECTAARSPSHPTGHPLDHLSTSSPPHRHRCCSCVEFQSRYLATPATPVLSSNTFQPPFRISECLAAIYSVAIALFASASRSSDATRRDATPQGQLAARNGPMLRRDEGICKVARRYGQRAMNGS